MIYLTRGEDFLRSSRLSALCSRIFACTARCATPPTYLAASKKTYPSAVLVFIIANGLLITPSSSLSSSFTSHPLSPPSVLYFFPSSLPPLQRASSRSLIVCIFSLNYISQLSGVWQFLLSRGACTQRDFCSPVFCIF